VIHFNRHGHNLQGTVQILPGFIRLHKTSPAAAEVVRSKKAARKLSVRKVLHLTAYLAYNVFCAFELCGRRNIFSKEAENQGSIL